MTRRGGFPTAPFDKYVRAAAGAVILLALVVLAGWGSGLRGLQTVFPGSVPMKPNAAVALTLAAVSLWMQRAGPPEGWRRHVAYACALLVLTIGALTLAEHLFDADIGLDQLLFKETHPIGSAVPGRMPPPPALSCVAIGCALLLLDTAASRWAVQPLILFSGLMGLTVLVGYSYDQSDLYRLGFYIQMAVPAAVAILVLSIAIALARPDHGMMVLLTSPGPGGLMARRLLLPAILLPFMLGWLHLIGEHRGLYDNRFGTALFTISNVVVFAILVGWNATVLQRTDEKRVQAEAAVRHSEERFRLLVDGAKDYAIFMLDASGRITTWNAGAERMKGYSAAEVIGAHFSRFYVTADVARGLPEVELQTAARDGRLEAEGWRVRKDGSQFWANAVITALRDADGGLLGFAKITRDMTDRKRAEDELKHAAKELARSNAELEQFAYVASHDLQEPLRAVAGCVDLLQRRYAGQLDARADEFITHARDGAARMRDLINDLLAYSRVSTHASTLAPIDCNVALSDAMANLTVAIRESGARVTTDRLPTVIADRTQITQLLQNLLGNAIKFRATRAPEIHVGVERNSGEWRFSVRDNGIGIDSQYSERIFKVFQRLHTRREYPGTGIGLAICKKIVERHGGRIWVTAQPDAGSTFHFTIPDRRAA